MSKKEINRLPVIKKLISHEMTVKRAAESLGLSDRHILRVKAVLGRRDLRPYSQRKRWPK